MKTTSTIRRNVRRGTAALVVGGAAAATLSMPAHAATEAQWDAVAQCESGGNWSTSTGNGFSGGLQFTASTWAANGGTGNPANASRGEQIRVAENVLATQGKGAWPVCGVGLGAASPQQSTPAAQTQQVEAPKAQAQAPVQQAAPAQQAAPVQQAAPAQTQYTAPAQTQQVAPAQTQYTAAAGTYTVQAGDTLSAIAAAHGVSWETLADANASTVSNPNLIYPGQVLEIPAA
ncbi:transglycosylase family protein [Rothia kristinae]|uniref:LysM peptidoglycan-binding domain-containing protein n=1 Tax=Rothia kristinae TaxID=37923 RepID=UPI0022E0BCB0|nr:transglycosylase family protein [Rothia kristinae]